MTDVWLALGAYVLLSWAGLLYCALTYHYKDKYDKKSSFSYLGHGAFIMAVWPFMFWMLPIAIIGRWFKEDD